MKNKILSAFIFLLLVTNFHVNAQEKDAKKIIYERLDNVNDPLPENLVPDKSTAIKVAEAIWLPLYGKRIYNEKPFVAELTKDDIWIVKGTVYGDKGGAAHIEIQKSDCKILKVYHQK